jgi:hypothetical protein
MTNGEKMIWAAAFSSSMREDEGGSSSRSRPQGRQHVAYCVEYAWSVVSYARHAVPDVKERCGEDSEAYQMLLEMVKL